MPLMSIICRPVVIGAAATGAQPSKPQRIAATDRHLVIIVVLSRGHLPQARCSVFAEPTRSRLMGCSSPNNGVPHGEAYALPRRAVALIDHAVDAGGGRRTLRRAPAEFEQGDTHAPDYLAVNPMGKVPALKHGDVVITETAAIC